MPRKLFLLADDRCFHQLRAAGLSGEILVDGERRAEPRRGSAEHAYIERRDPAALIPARPGNEDEDEDPATLDVEERDLLFANLLGSIVCHLVVLENDPDSPTAGEQVVLKSGRAVKQLESWYQKFQAEVAQRVDYRQHEYRHVLILICAEEVTYKQFAPLAGLLEQEGDRPIDACYIMLRRLNWGQSDVCFSRYVWPISVGRLLLGLMASQHEARFASQRDGATPLVAWRTIELVPDVPSELVQGHFRNCFDQVYDDLFAKQTDGLSWDQAAFDPQPMLRKEELKKPPIAFADQWHTFNSKRACETVSDPRRWDRALSENGNRFAAKVAEDVLVKDCESSEQACRVWGQLHGNPHVLAGALAQPAITAGPDVNAELRRLLASFNALVDNSLRRAEAIEDAKGCAEVIEEAQRGFVNRNMRGLITGCVAALIAYASSMLLGELFWEWRDPATWTIPLVVAGFGILGALAAMVVPWMLERRAGLRAVNTFTDEVLPALDEKMIRRDWACQQLREDGHRFWAKSRAASAVHRLRLLLGRLRVIVDSELRFAEPAAENLAGAGFDNNGSPRRGRRQEQQREFRKQTRVTQATSSFRVDDSQLDQLTESLADQLRQVWGDLCQQHDKQRAGNMPAQEWIPALREFREQFAAALAENIHSQAIRHMTADRDQSWVAKVQTFLNQDYSYYMSCPVQTTEIDRRHRAIRLLVRRDLVDQHVGDHLQDVSVAPNETMDALPLFGLLLDEAPIKLGEGDDGYVRAIAYEA